MSSHAPTDGSAAPDGPRAPTAPRSLAEALRAHDDDFLAALLRARPDLLNPVPTDITQLATRAGTRASVVRALERLDRFSLRTAEALAVAPDPAPYKVLLSLMTGRDGDAATERALPGAVEVLRGQALLWGEGDRLRLVRTARELLAPSPNSPSPTGLGPTVAEAASGMSPGRVQAIVADAGLDATPDPVSATTALKALFEDPRRMKALLKDAPADALAVLERLAWGPPYGKVTAEPASYLRWLLNRGLLLPTAPGTVVLPREAALHLRGGRAHRHVEPLPPEVRTSATHGARIVDATAAGQAWTALATVEELLRDWDEGGPAVLRAGGVSMRDLKRTATALDVTEPIAAFWLELAHAAGLLASDGEADERFAATPGYDAWLELPDHERWSRLAGAWLAGTRTPGLVGGRDAKDRPLSALGPGLDRSAAPEVRRRVLELLAEMPEGAAPVPDSVRERLAWERPSRSSSPQAARDGAPAGTPGAPGGPADPYAAAGTSGGPAAGRTAADEPRERHTDLRSRLAHWTLEQAELLGVTGRGALSAPGRALLGRDPAEETGTTDTPTETPTGAPADARADAPPVVPTPVPVPLSAQATAAAAAHAARLLAPLLPEPVDEVLLQADLTAVAPGPLRRPLAQRLAVLADVESKGGATVYRFTPGSVRRALDAGQSASDVQAFLATHSRTPVPQPLAYLIDDVARRHGHLRIGAASSYVRCDDEAVLGEILADRRAAGLKLRLLAPTVLAAQADPGTLLEGLRQMGFAPAAESADGDVVISRADSRRTGPRSAPEPVVDGPPSPGPETLRAAVRAVRGGDLAATMPRKQLPDSDSPGGDLPRSSAADTLATLQAATLTGEVLCIGHVNAEGIAARTVIAPLRVEGGFVTAYDHTTEAARTFALHRITGVAELAEE